ncbi:two-component hybrid sensor and regulator [Sulfurimonas gotlandica GD1]|uniref:histidine kinase n=1 Tax=Sulfurimonas gotlandica (strain DSM 19862 / JCM 16533 / GD1) TaxID=929558 RepID=B6BK47_SULGG|nr:ATP-binding protein [Sulfurimonas gotlandica]EDZ62745.1 multi-sensor hybrid histidine kinase [Sulfurimonas gotlandica GD1]EHP31138.1 two-component hybrid sensor and regulator [Sulfurimonas gotlandica GD1]
MNLNMSLQNKIFSIFIVVLTLGIGFVGWYGYKTASEGYIESAYKLSERDTNNLTIEIEGNLGHVTKDALYIKEFYALKRYMIWKSMSVDTKAQMWKDIFSDALLDFLKAQKDYYKIRVVDLDGKELLVVKYDEKSNSAYLLADSELQNNSGRNYLEVPKTLKKDEFFISDMNLNIEYGKIEQPFIPVVRYSTPIISDNGNMIGVFVVNIYANNILNIVNQASINGAKKGFSYFLIDKEGNYLFNKDESKTWGSQIKGKSNFNDDHFNLKKFMKDKSKGTFIHNNKIYSYRAVHPLKQNSENYWYAISSVDTNIALEKLDDFKQLFIFILLFVVIISFFIIKFYLLKITTPLAQVTSQLKALSRGEIKKEEINYSGNDEISEIVNSTQKVIDAIETTISQANAVADGDFSKEIELLGKNDQLGLAITDMTKRLKEITSLAKKLSTGNYDTKIIAKSSEDRLGMALIDMIKYLEVVASVAESIAEGNIDVDYKIVGEEDRLGIAMLKMIAYLRGIVSQADAITKNDFSKNIEVKSKNDELGIALGIMTNMLQENDIKNKNEIYFSDGIGEFSDKLTGISDTMELSKKAITMASRYVDACSGVAYIYDKEKGELGLIASYSFNPKDSSSNIFKLGNGVIGQVGLEKKSILLKNVENEHYDVKTGTTLSKPKEVFVLPLIHEGELFGVAELMTFESFSKVQKDYLKKASEIFTTSLFAATQNMQIKVLLEDSKRAYEELQVQSEELQESNVQMEEQQQQLTLQAKSMKIKNDELLQAKEDLDKRADDLEKASKYKSEFLANMSHELRTPLNSIILLSKLLTQNKKETLSDSDVSKTSVIHKAGNDLLLLINDILDLSKIESGNMELNESEFDTSEIREEIEGLFSEVAKEKNLNFEVRDSFNRSFIVDKTKLLQIIKNLLSNAFKFTKSGEVSLSVFKKNRDIVFEVSDTGIGIPEAKLALIFEAFKQVDGSISREYGGTGLGLSISKTFINLMGGRIEVDSKEGIGSSFLVILPIEKDDYEKETSSKIEVTDIILADDEIELFDKELLKSKNILIVDDDSRNIFTLSSVVQELGADTYSALNGEDAFKLLEEEEANMDVILMDIMMPIMDGLKTIEKIKADERFKHIPIIAVTAKVMKEDKRMCYEAGANDYLAKPIDQNALISMLKAWSK